MPVLDGYCAVLGAVMGATVTSPPPGSVPALPPPLSDPSSVLRRTRRGHGGDTDPLPSPKRRRLGTGQDSARLWAFDGVG